MAQITLYMIAFRQQATMMSNVTLPGMEADRTGEGYSLGCRLSVVARWNPTVVTASP